MGSIFRIRFMLFSVNSMVKKRVEKLMNRKRKKKGGTESKIKGEIGTYTKPTRYTTIVLCFQFMTYRYASVNIVLRFFLECVNSTVQRNIFRVNIPENYTSVFNS